MAETGKISEAILELAKWLKDDGKTEFERGYILGLRAAVVIAESLEGKDDD